MAKDQQQCWIDDLSRSGVHGKGPISHGSYIVPHCSPPKLRGSTIKGSATKSGHDITSFSRQRHWSLGQPS